MEILITAVIFILKLIISIGDATITVLSLLMQIIIKVYDLLLRLYSFINKSVIKIYKFLVSRFEIIKSKTPKIKKRKRVKETKIFPLPAGIKIKYFIIGSLFSFIFIFIPLLTLIFLQDLPSPRTLSFQQDPLTTKIYDRNGALLYQIYATQNRTLVPLSSVPEYLQEATIAIEDKNFYQNAGFDIGAIARAFLADISGKPLQGGSTITQQLIKSTLLTPQVSLTRKIKELVLSFWAEHIYTKGQILQMYFNQVPYGGTAWGVEAASEVYFGKDVKDLDLAESAFLAGLPRAPTLYSPYGEHPNLWRKRQKEVLSRMVDLGFITKSQEKEALGETLVFLPSQNPIHAPHFVMYVKDLLIKKYGLPMVEKGGLSVTTSLDLKIQDMAQNVVKNEIEKDAYLNLTNGAALVTDPKNGDILSMVGSHDYNDPTGGNVNVATSLRQPGSSIKVVTYSAALSHGFTAATLINDSPVTFTSPGAPLYSPVNYDQRFHGFVTLREALGNSINVPAVKTLNAIGVKTMVDLAKKMGITTWGQSNRYGLAITLGAADVRMTDMATVYGVLANEGHRVNLNPILKVTDSSGNVLEKKNNIQRKQVIDPGVAFIISNILADNNARAMEFGINSPLLIPGHTVSVKTGTSDNKRDNWTIGYTPDYVVSVWVGNNDNSPMSQALASGITGAAPIWHNIMSYLLDSHQDEKIPVPSDIVQKLCLGKIEYFIKGTENLVNCKSPLLPSTSPAKP